MKKQLTFLTKSLLMLALGFLTLSLSARTIKTNSEGKTSLELTGKTDLKLELVNYVGKLKFVFVDTEKGEFVRLQVPGYAKSQKIGSPELPFRGRLIEVPYGATPVVKITGYDVKEYNLADIDVFAKIIPCQGPQSKCGENPDFQWNKDEYKVNSFNRDPLVTVDVLGFMRGVQIGRINISPVQYNPKKNIVRVYENLTFEITFKGADLAKTQELKKRYYSPYFESTYKHLLNYSSLQSKSNLTKYPVKYAILTDPQFVDQIQDFVNWKTKKGFNVVLATTDEVGTGKEQVKAWLKGLYDAGTEEDPAPSFALLIGDKGQIQPWDNGDGVTDRNSCEYTGDLFPEIFYGRFSAQNAAQLQPYLDKTLMYEEYTMPNPSYLDTVVMIAGMDGSYGSDWGNGQINYGTINYFNEDHGIFSHTYLYPNSGPNAATIRQNISDGVTFANYTAHCSPNGWADPQFTIGQINDLQNDGKYGLLVGNCCQSSDFSTECFAEEIVRAANKGAVGYIGGSNSTFWDEDYYFGVGYGTISENPPSYEETGLGLYDRAFHDHGEAFGEWYTTMDQHIFAGNLAVSESGSPREQYYWDIYNLMGDPSLMIYYSVPDPLTVTAPSVVLLGVTSLNIQTVPYGYAALSFNGELKAAALADSLGNVELMFEPFTVPGQVDLVVTAQNYQPYISTIEVIPADGPYITYSNHYVNDTATGNANGKIDYNEEAFITIGMKNVGSDMATNVEVTLSTADTLLTILDGEENYGNIDTSEVVTKENGFKVKASAATPNGHIVNFTVTSIFNNDTTVSYFNEVIVAPELAFVSYSINDSDGNGNGKLDPGETVQMAVTIKNVGLSKAENVTGTLSVEGEWISITQADMVYGDLLCGDTATATFEVTADGDTPAGYIANFLLNMSGDYNITAEAQFSMVVGQKPVIVINLADLQTSADSMMAAFEVLSVSADYVSQVPDNLYQYQCAFVALGIYSDNHALTDNEGSKLAQFLDDGGRLYMEGGDTWYYNSPTPVHQYFHINGLADGSDTFEHLVGDTASFMKGFEFDYVGANNWMDEIEPADSDAFVLLNNVSSDYNGPAVIAYANDTYKTIGSVSEFGGLEPGGTFGTGGNQAGYMAEILNFFGVNFVWTGVNNMEESENTVSISPNPAKDFVKVNVNTKDVKNTEIKIYDVAGKMVYHKTLKLKNGSNQFTLDLSGLKTGFYTVDILNEGNVNSRKLIITK